MRRPAIVFIHGVRSSRALWHPQLEAVRAEGYEAVAVDLPGHGARRDERFSLAGAMEVVDDAVASVGDGTGPVVVVGLSLGGYVSLEYAARRPARLAGIVASACTCDPHGKPVLLYRDVAHQVARAVGAARANLPRVPGLARLMRSSPHPVHAGRALQVDGTAATYRPGWDVVTDMLGQLAGRSAIDNVVRSEVPVWFVNGKRDHLRLEEKRYLAAAPHARLVVLPGAGHDVSSEAPDAYNTVLLGALADIEAGRAAMPGSVGTARRAGARRTPATVPNAPAV